MRFNTFYCSYYLIPTYCLIPTYYRVTYTTKSGPVGIYAALKEAVGYKWKQLKEDERISWLPLPVITYTKNHRSYFTQVGYDRFKVDTLPLVLEYLDESKIVTEEFTKITGIVYSDEYQVVTKS